MCYICVFFYVWSDSVSNSNLRLHPSMCPYLHLWVLSCALISASIFSKLLFYGISALSDYILWKDVWAPDVLSVSYLFFWSPMAQAHFSSYAYPSFNTSSKQCTDICTFKKCTTQGNVREQTRTEEEDFALYLFVNSRQLQHSQEGDLWGNQDNKKCDLHSIPRAHSMDIYWPLCTKYKMFYMWHVLMLLLC